MLALESRELTVGWDAAAAALKARKAWGATAALHADAQRDLLLAPHEETAHTTEWTREMHQQRHELKLETMPAARKAGRKPLSSARCSRRS